MTKFEDLRERHQAAIKAEEHLEREAAELRRTAKSASSGVSFQLRAKADRLRNRAFGARMRQSDIEDEMCNLAEKDEDALQYMTDYYDMLGVLPKEG